MKPDILYSQNPGAAIREGAPLEVDGICPRCGSIAKYQARGGLLAAQFYCPNCGTVPDRRVHGGERPTSISERGSDLGYLSREGIAHRIFIRLFRKHVNRFVKWMLGLAFERSQIKSFAFHEMCGICDRALWPEHYSPESPFPDMPRNGK